MGTSKSFKYVSYAEGWSFVVLLLFAMPMKYIFNMPIFVKYVGWAHGVLFVAYIISLIVTALEEKWNFKLIVLGFLASLLPLGPFIFHKKFLTSEH